MLLPEVCAVSYSRVSSERQDVELSVSGQQRAIREWAEKNGYVLVGEYVDEAQSGRIDTRDGFSRMIDNACAPNPRFKTILVWKHDRFSRRRVHSVIYKARLRDHGVRLVSISEPSDETPSGRLLESMMEGIVEFYSENLSEDVLRGMREAALRGSFLGPKPPYGYRKIKVPDRERRPRITLEVVPEEAKTVLYVYERSLQGLGIKEIAIDLNAQGITNRGRTWHKNSLHWVLTNEANAGTLVWGRRGKRMKAFAPVRMEDAWPAIVTRDMFCQVQSALAVRSPAKGLAREKPVFLLAGLLMCGSCGKKYMVQGAKGNRYFYYVCGTLVQRGAGTCQAKYYNAAFMDGAFIEKFSEQITSPETLSRLTVSSTLAISSAADRFTDLLSQVHKNLEDIEQDLVVKLDPAISRPVSLDCVLPQQPFRHNQQAQLTFLQEELSRCKQRIDQLAVYFGPDGRRDDLQAMVEEVRQALAYGTVETRQETIRLLVDRVVVDRNGRLDIQAKFPFG